VSQGVARKSGDATGARTSANRGARFLAACLLLAFAIACVARFAGEPTGHRRTELVEDPGAFVGSEICLDCHDSFRGHFVRSEFHADCESCHGPAERHLYSARAVDIAYPSSETCAACHRIAETTLLGWSNSDHARAGVLCSDCHNTHNRELQHLRKTESPDEGLMLHAGAASRMCASCHPQITAQLELPAHHPILEGMLECTDCHSPHQSRDRSLGARTAVCTECHQDVAGPWIYEHAPATEDCGYCHTPHGSSVDFLLIASQPAACISCHTIPIAGAIHLPYAFSTACTDCHNAVHGSDSDPHLRR